MGNRGQLLRRVGWLAAAAVLLAGGAALAAFPPDSRAVQPIQFDHKLHVSQDMTCDTCHEQVEKGARATLPSVDDCMGCHADAQGSSPEEPKVRRYADEGEQIPWVRVNRMPGHVYFPHRNHVKLAKLDCAVCHGDMKNASSPPPRSQVAGLSMRKCMRCHTERGVSNDCIGCHE